MADIFEFKREEPAVPHATGEAHCLDCKHDWIAVVEAEQLRAHEGWIDCPACELMRGRMKYPFAPVAGTHIWRCFCGNEFFYLSRDSVICPNCGVCQEFPA